MEERVEVVDGARAAHRRREGYRGGSDGDEVRVRVRARVTVTDRTVKKRSYVACTPRVNCFLIVVSCVYSNVEPGSRSR